MDRIWTRGPRRPRACATPLVVLDGAPSRTGAGQTRWREPQRGHPMGYTRGVGGSPCQALWRPTGHAHQWGIMERDRKAFSARGREAPPRQDPWRGGECRGDRGPSERSHGTDSQPWGEQGLDSQGAPVTSLLRMLTASWGGGTPGDFRGAGLKLPLPHAFLPAPRPQHDRSGAQSPADPSKVSWGIPASHAAGGGQAPGG